MFKLRHEEQTYNLRKLIFQVHNDLKAGWAEEIYHQALFQLLQGQGIPACFKPRKSIFHRGVEVHTFEADLIVWDLIILELKMMPQISSFAPSHYAQIIHYLKCWSKDLGLLVNFGPTKVQIERIVWDEPTLDVYENYDAVKADFSATDRLYLRQVRKIILGAAQEYGIGYPATMYRHILAIELEHNGLNCLPDVIVPARFGDRILAQHATDHLLVAERYLMNVRSLYLRPPAYEFMRTKTYLNQLGLEFGLLLNFGKKQLQIYGVKAT
jgi:GxxExxY protein